MPTIIRWFNITPTYKAFDLRSTLNLLTCAFSNTKNIVFTAYSCFIAIQKSNIAFKLSYLSMFPIITSYQNLFTYLINHLVKLTCKCRYQLLPKYEQMSIEWPRWNPLKTECYMYSSDSCIYITDWLYFNNDN